jgi:hypothetical protein
MENQTNNIPLLSELLDQFEMGTLDLQERARKCYLTEKEKHFNRHTWIHNDELKNQSVLRGLSRNGGRDLLRQTKEKL